MLLLLRFYDVQSGAVLVDGLDVRRWNLRYLRDTMGLVQQVCLPIAASFFVFAPHSRYLPYTGACALREFNP